MYYILDRFEEEFALLQCLETQEIINIKKELLPFEAKEGEVFEKKEDAWVFNEKETENRKKIINDKFNSLWK